MFVPFALMPTQDQAPAPACFQTASEDNTHLWH
jgi:hypothetical protein